MFYSQFILAKKGPLGTIWIAAHLDRKLRKNQVADTDIGVSVDSILFPDAPIALRLSSHLLLGVVRIYSKKVNYLFNDCSEALVKIKHAFRSTAVDLPPEESTAPYHSITLPENFDLDNFELPDSAFLDSNFVDHHVSTREQITLQDTVNDTAFPTSKFGLDERFGDEDASQIDLEIDEELFMDKKVSPHHDEDSMISKVSGLHHGETSVLSTSMAVDKEFGRDEEKYNEIPNELSELLSNNYDKNSFSGLEDVRRDTNSSQRHGYTIQTPDLNELFQPECPTALSTHVPFTPIDIQRLCLVEPAQEPSTPALLEVVPSHLQVPVLSPQEKAETCIEPGKPGSCTSLYMEVECSEAGNKTSHASAELDNKSGEIVHGLPLSSALISPISESITPTYSTWNSTTDNVHMVSAAECQQNISTGNELNNISTSDHRLDKEAVINSSVFSHEAITLIPPPKQAALFEVVPATSNICTDNMDVSGDILHVAMKGCNKPTEIANLGRLEDGNSCLSTSVVGSDFLPRSCDSNMHQRSSPFIQTAPFEAEPATSNICMSNMDVSRVNLDLGRTPLKGSNEISNLGCGDGGESYLSTSITGSDFLLRSCGSNLHLPSSLFTDEDFAEASELSLRDNCFSQKNPMMEEVQHISRSSFEVQGEGLSYTNDRFINLEGQNISGYTTIDFKYGARKPDELSMGIISKVSHLNNEKYSSSSEFLGPEKMLAPTFVDFPSYQALQAADKEVTQSDGIADRNNSHLSKKRPFMDTSTSLQTSTSAKLFELPSTKRNTDYIPDDNDVLATILDGRMAPSLKTGSIPPLSLKTDSIPSLSLKTGSIPSLSLKTGSIPPLSKQSSQKRPRTMSRVSMPRRRKVLVDDAMVLHADAIRQQLINTEDIRRMRKKAPCTRPEIWKIYIGAMEEDTFDRSILTGISVELNNSCNLKYDTQKDPSSLELISQVKTSGDTGSSRVSDFFMEMGDKEMNERVLSVHGAVNRSGPSSIAESATVQTREIDAQADLFDQQKLPVRPQMGPFRNDHTSVVGSSRVLGFFDEMVDKEMNERISRVNSVTNINDGSSNTTASTTVQTHEFGAQCDPKLPVHSHVGSFSNNQASIIDSSMVLEVFNEIGDKKINERVSSVPRNDEPSIMNASVTVRTHEVGAQYDLHDQLRKLPVQPQVGPFSNDQTSVICAIQPDAEILLTSIIQETPISEIGNNISSVEKLTDKSINQAEEYDTRAKTSGGTGSSRFLEFSSDMDAKLNERVSSVPGIVNRNFGSSNITASAKIQTHEGSGHHDLYGQLNKLPVQPPVGPFSNEQAPAICAMQPDIETCPTSTMQVTRIPENGKSISSLGKFTNRSINQAEEFDNRAKTSEGMFLEFSSEMGDTEMIDRISSVPSIVNRNFCPSSITASARVQTHEDGAHYDMYGQLNKLPVQPQVGLFSNDQASMICAMRPHVETRPNSYIQEAAIPENDKSISSDEKITDKNIALSEGYGSRVKAPGETGSSRFLEFPSETSNKGMSERILSVPIIINRNDCTESITSSSTVQRNEVGVQYDMHDQLEKLPVHLEVGPFRNDQSFLTCVRQPDAETQVNSSISSAEKLSDKINNFAQKSLHNTHNLFTPNNGSACAECTTVVRINGDVAVEPLTAQSLIQTENLCNTVGAIINGEEKNRNVMDTKQSESIHTNNLVTGGAVFHMQKSPVDRETELLLEKTHGSAVVAATDGTVETLGDRGKPVNDVTCAEQNEDEGRPVSDVRCAEQNIAFYPSSVDHAPSTVGGNSGINDHSLEGDMDVDCIPLDIGAARDSSDFCSAIDDNYTGFLNEDYEDAVLGEAEDNAPNCEDDQSPENSGWSARTRGVARYLKNLFDEESGQGRKSISVNRLLVGKTRKEASRMFFETLVLKTRDYIQVEQENPFEYINITPRIKLLKSEF